MTGPAITIQVGDEVRYECPLGPAWGRVVGGGADACGDPDPQCLIVDTIFETGVEVTVEEITDWRRGPEWRRQR